MEIWCRNSHILCLQALFFYVVSVFFFSFPPPGNKGPYSLLVNVPWVLSVSHLHLIDNLFILPELCPRMAFFVGPMGPNPGSVVDRATQSNAVSQWLLLFANLCAVLRYRARGHLAFPTMVEVASCAFGVPSG